MKSQEKNRSLVSAERLKKLRAQFPEFFKFNESGLLSVHSPASDISHALMVSMLGCSDAEFLAHCRTLSDFARGGTYYLWTLSRSEKLNPERRVYVLKILIEIHRKSLSDLERYAQSEVKKLEKAKKCHSNIPTNAVSLVEAVARKAKDWPALTPRNNMKAKNQRAFIINKLGLAKDYPFNVEGKRAAPKITTPEGKRMTSPGYTAAEIIITKILSYRSNDWPAEFNSIKNESLLNEARLLSPPSFKTRDSWWTVAEKMLVEIWGEEFWKHQHFQAFVGKRDGSARYLDSGEKSGSLKVRILKSVKQNFFSYYKPLSRGSKSVGSTNPTTSN